MIPRRVEQRVLDRLASVPAVFLVGPRQVGKTTLARKIAAGRPSVYLDLERPADRRRLDDADAYLRAQSGRLVVLDEVHRAPSIFEILRGIIDDRRMAGERAGHFLLLGSASLDLLKQSSETLAGRISVLDIDPIDAAEAMEAGRGVDQLWLRGGLPDSLLATDDEASFEWRQDFIRSYLDRDVPMFAPRLPAETIGRLWTMLAHGQGSLLNLARLASGLGISQPAVARYVDLLVDLKLVRRLRPWHGNIGKRLTRSPKTYVRDSGIVHGLLEIRTLDALAGHPVVGLDWEGFVIENLVTTAGPGRVPFFFRTADGAEIDLVFEVGGRPSIAVEVKRSLAPSVERGFTIAADTIDIVRRVVVYPGTERFPLRGGVEAMPLIEAMAEVATL